MRVHSGMRIRTPGVTLFTLAPITCFLILFTMAQRKIADVAKPDPVLELTLRPSLFSEFTGQNKVKDRLEITVAAAVGAALRSVDAGLRAVRGEPQNAR